MIVKDKGLTVESMKGLVKWKTTIVIKKRLVFLSEMEKLMSHWIKKVEA